MEIKERDLKKHHIIEVYYREQRDLYNLAKITNNYRYFLLLMTNYYPVVT
jgi:hypothetical protein